MQLEELLTEVVPAGQDEAYRVGSKPVQRVPAVQGVQDVAPEADMEPAGQATLAEVVGQEKPSGQSAQRSIEPVR